MSDDLFPGFASHWIDTEAGRIFCRAGGDGPPLVCLHGFPQTHAMWHRIAAVLAGTHRVVCMDLRGYGWSSVPRSDPAHETYSKRAMAQDVIAVMEALGHVRFAVAGHDRGGRVAYRLGLDHPERVDRIALLDILPTFHVWREIKAGRQEARHWGFLAEPAPKPEEEIGRDPHAYFEGRMRDWAGDKTLAFMDPRARALYRNGYNEPNRIHAFCEDYRAGATRDVEQDEADMAAGRTLAAPVFLIASQFYLARGAVSAIEVWRQSLAPQAEAVELDCGHFVAEERPAETAAALTRFLA